MNGEKIILLNSFAFSPFVTFEFAPVARIYHLIVSSYCPAFTVAPIVLLYVHCIVQLTTSGRL